MTERDEYILDDRVEIEITLRNVRESPILVERASYRVSRYRGERRTETGWEPAIAPILIDQAHAPIELTSGKSFDAVIGLSAGSIVGPQRGIYRLIFQVRDAGSGELLPADLRRSNAFRIE